VSSSVTKDKWDTWKTGCDESAWAARKADVCAADDSCVWVENNENTQNEKRVDDANCREECIANVRASCPTATIANYAINGNGCYCQFQTNMDQVTGAGWENCLLRREFFISLYLSLQLNISIINRRP